MGAPQLIEEKKLYRITGVEIFSVGKWNDRKITHDDLQDMVRSFNDLKVGWRPFLKLGHDNKQLVAKVNGLPAIGWVENVYARGDKLLADFNDIPEKVFNLIKQKSYRKVSCEVYFGLDVNGTKYNAVLGAVALLGAENPGVMNLTDILGQFEKWEQSEVFAILEKQDTFEQYPVNFELNEEDGAMPQTLEQLEADLAEQKRLNEEAKKNFELEQAKSKELAEKSEKEIEDLRKFKADADAKAVQAELDAREAKRQAFMTKLEADKLVTPASKKLIEQLIGEKQEFALEEKACTREEIVEKILNLTVEAAKVNFDESSLAEFAKGKDDDDGDEKAISEYMAKEKCSYQEAYKKVMKAKKK